MILEKKADVCGVDDTGRSPLYIAVYENHYDIAKLLIEVKSNVNLPTKIGDTPIIAAVQQNNPKIVKMLIENGALINWTNYNGQIALDFTTRCHSSIASYFMRQFRFDEAKFFRCSSLKHIRLLSSGHFGVAYRAELKFRRSSPVMMEVVCKCPLSGASQDEWYELKVLQNLSTHPNVVSFLGMCMDFVPPDNVEVMSMIMPFLSGGPLRKCVDQVRVPLTLEELVLFAIDMVAGLQHLHKSGYVHNDVALRNFLLAKDNSAQLKPTELWKPMEMQEQVENLTPLIEEEKDEKQSDDSTITGNKIHISKKYPQNYSGTIIDNSHIKLTMSVASGEAVRCLVFPRTPPLQKVCYTLDLSSFNVGDEVTVYGTLYQGNILFSRLSDELTSGKNEYCSYIDTAARHFFGTYVECYTCKPLKTWTCCMKCANVCHKDHYLSEEKRGKFYCDCGAGLLSPMPCSLMPKRIELTSYESEDLEFFLQQTQKTLLTDFGLARPFQDETTASETSASDGPLSLIPLRWSSWETISSRGAVLTTCSDIWMLGIAFWEMIYPRRKPFFWLTDTQFLRGLSERHLDLMTPSTTPQVWGGIISACLKYEPAERVTLKTLHSTLRSLLDRLKSNQPQDSSIAHAETLVNDCFAASKSPEIGEDKTTIPPIQDDVCNLEKQFRLQKETDIYYGPHCDGKATQTTYDGGDKKEQRKDAVSQAELQKQVQCLQAELRSKNKLIDKLQHELNTLQSNYVDVDD